jgi:hypothetical protein
MGENVKERYCFDALSTAGRIIFKCILKKTYGRVWTGLIWLKTVTSGGLCEHGDEQSGCTTCGEFLRKH